MCFGGAAAVSEVSLARSLGVGGFTDPEIDSIDAGKKFEQRQTLLTVLVFAVKTRLILPTKYQDINLPYYMFGKILQLETKYNFSTRQLL